MWKEVAWNMMEMGQARRGVVDETSCEWMTLEVRAKGQHDSCQILSHRHVRVRVKRCAKLTTRRKIVRATRCSVFSSQRWRNVTPATFFYVNSSCNSQVEKTQNPTTWKGAQNQLIGSPCSILCHPRRQLIFRASSCFAQKLCKTLRNPTTSQPF